MLFLHWEVPLEVLRDSVPESLNLDSFEGKYYVSLVGFTMQNVRKNKLPAVSFISNFHEINLRTYIDNGNKKGVFFLNIEAEKLLSVFIAKRLSGLPYEKSDIKRTDGNYISTNIKKGFNLDTEFVIKDKLKIKSALDKWLTERYCLYLNKGDKICRYDIHHKEWEIKTVEIKHLSLKYKINTINLSNRQPDLVHYSDGVKVVSWKKQTIGG